MRGGLVSGLSLISTRHFLRAERWRALFYRAVRLFGCPEKARAVADADRRAQRQQEWETIHFRLCLFLKKRMLEEN